jgi:hypothetical protein
MQNFDAGPLALQRETPSPVRRQSVAVIPVAFGVSVLYLLSLQALNFVLFARGPSSRTKEQTTVVCSAPPTESITERQRKLRGLRLGDPLQGSRSGGLSNVGPVGAPVGSLGRLGTQTTSGTQFGANVTSENGSSLRRNPAPAVRCSGRVRKRCRTASRRPSACIHAGLCELSPLSRDHTV